MLVVSYRAPLSCIILLALWYAFAGKGEVHNVQKVSKFRHGQQKLQHVRIEFINNQQDINVYGK